MILAGRLVVETSEIFLICRDRGDLTAELRKRNGHRSLAVGDRLVCGSICLARVSYSDVVGAELLKDSDSRVVGVGRGKSLEACLGGKERVAGARSQGAVLVVVFPPCGAEGEELVFQNRAAESAAPAIVDIARNDGGVQPSEEFSPEAQKPNCGPLETPVWRELVKSPEYR